MSKNILYHYVSLYFDALTKKYSIEKKTNLKGASYFLFGLTTPDHQLMDEKTNQNYQLIQDHLSIYETEKNNNPNLSQYHYTASLTTLENIRYTLHVYFDRNDVLTQSPILKQEDEKDGEPINLSEGLSYLFVSLAKNSVRPILLDLRTQLKNAREDLKNQYHRLDIELSELTTYSPHENQRYDKVFKKITASLNALVLLSQDSHYFHALEILKNQKNIPSEVEKKPLKKETQKQKHQALNVLSVENIQTLSKTEKTASKKRASNFDIATIENSINTFDTLDSAQQIQKIGPLLQEIRSSQLLLAHKEKESLKRLKEIENIILQRGKVLLTHYLIQENCELTEAFHLWKHFISAADFVKSLKSHNAGAIDFILTNCDFSVNHFSFKTNKSYDSPMHYFFNTDLKDNLVIECLIALIKHGGSLLLTCQKTNLPLCFEVIADPHHPFYPVLEHFKEKTLLSENFLRELRADLQFYLQTHPSIDEALKQKIILVIASCHERIHALSLNHALNKEILTFKDDFISRKELHPNPTVRRLLENEELSPLFYHLLEKSSTLSNVRKGLKRWTNQSVDSEKPYEVSELLDSILYKIVFFDDAEKSDEQKIEGIKKRIVLAERFIELFQRTSKNCLSMISHSKHFKHGVRAKRKKETEMNNFLPELTLIHKKIGDIYIVERDRNTGEIIVPTSHNSRSYVLLYPSSKNITFFSPLEKNKISCEIEFELEFAENVLKDSTASNTL